MRSGEVDLALNPRDQSSVVAAFGLHLVGSHGGDEWEKVTEMAVVLLVHGWILRLVLRLPW
jgi:hypothetical protein